MQSRLMQKRRDHLQSLVSNRPLELHVPHTVKHFPAREQSWAIQSASTYGGNYMLTNGTVDYYEVLGVDDDAPYEEIKKAYRALAKECHPDYLGEEGHNICILLNEAYQVLSDEAERARYNTLLNQALIDEEDNYTGEPLSKWMPVLNPKMARNENPAEDRAVFVDELSCIGCKQCVWAAPATFRLENLHGRSRVYAQWLDTEDRLQSAIDACPVSCIHWVKRADLPILEHVTQHVITDRVNVGVMMAGQGAVRDVFGTAATFAKQRQRKEEEESLSRRAKPYSSTQEAARRAATAALKKKQQSSSIFSQVAGAFEDALNSMNMFVGDDDTSGKRVGSRRRSVKWQARQPSEPGVLTQVAEGYSVPEERALVPIAVARR